MFIFMSLTMGLIHILGSLSSQTMHYLYISAHEMNLPCNKTYPHNASQTYSFHFKNSVLNTRMLFDWEVNVFRIAILLLKLESGTGFLCFGWKEFRHGINTGVKKLKYNQSMGKTVLYSYSNAIHFIIEWFGSSSKVTFSKEIIRLTKLKFHTNFQLEFEYFFHFFSISNNKLPLCTHLLRKFCYMRIMPKYAKMCFERF